MRLLITRPREDAEALAAILHTRGHVCVVAPLMDARFMEGEVIALDAVQGIVATSANGVRALARRAPRRDIVLYAVGPQTAEAAREEGFRTIVESQGDAQALAQTIIARAKPGEGALFHAAGAETAGRLKQTLQAAGFSVEAPVLYDAVAATELFAEAARALQEDALDGVLLFSPRSAKIFVALVKKAGLDAYCARLAMFAISAATAAELGDLGSDRILVAAEPNQDAILALLEQAP